MTRKALVVGGSIGGLFAGLMLRRCGWDVTVFERSAVALGSRGTGIVTHDILHDLLAQAVGSRNDIGVRVTGRTVLAANGSTICQNQTPQIVASWDKVWLRLRASAGDIYREDHALEDLKQGSAGVEAIFANGKRYSGDILVAADGIQSTVRRIVMPQIEPQYAGYIAWRGLVEDHQLSQSTHEQLLDRFTFCLPQSEQMLGYPVDGGANEGLRYNYVWYRPSHKDNDLPRLLTGQNGKLHRGGIAPDQITQEVLAEMRHAARHLLAPAFAEVVMKTVQPLLQPIHDLEVETMRIKRIVLLGDAAFVARPHVGMGVTKAAMDAGALADCLATEGDIDCALENYSNLRGTEGKSIIRRARHLGAYMQAQLLHHEDRMHADAHRNPESVMAETATMAGVENW